MSCDKPCREAQPVLIEYRELVRCNARIDALFDGRGWEVAAGEGDRDVLFVHRSRLGCYRSAAGKGAPFRGCAAMPHPFGDFAVTLETAIREDGPGHRIESELQLFFFALREDRRRDLWGGKITFTSAPDGALTDLGLDATAGVLDGAGLLGRLHRRQGCRLADSTCWQVLLGTTVVDAAVAR